MAKLTNTFISQIWTLMTPFERSLSFSLSKLSENHKIIEIGSTEFKLWQLKDIAQKTGLILKKHPRLPTKNRRLILLMSAFPSLKNSLPCKQCPSQSKSHSSMEWIPDKPEYSQLCEWVSTVCKIVLDLLGTVTLLVLCQRLSPVVKGIPQPAHLKRYTYRGRGRWKVNKVLKISTENIHTNHNHTNAH